jgi:hybrid cluster-associated redox disulfide protein
MLKYKYKRILEDVVMKITKNITIGELVRTYPQTIKALMGFGMGCVGCPSAQAETLEEAAAVHGIDVDLLIEKLNQVV